VSSIPILQEPAKGQPLPPSFFASDEIPLTVKQAAFYLGVSPQTVYLWVERKQIPHLRVMGKNIRFLKSDLAPFRATFNRRWELARPRRHDGSIYPRKDGKVLWMVYRDRNGKRIRESTYTEDWQEAQRKLRSRLQARDDKILDIVRKGEQLQFVDWAVAAGRCEGV